MTNLILLSGGLDSTSCLLKLLDETDEEIQAVYIDVGNNTEKSWCEREAIHQILNEVEKKFIRPNLSICKVELAGSCSNLGQPPVWGLLASFVADSCSADKIYLGYTKGDTILGENYPRTVNKYWELVWKLISVKKRPKLVFPIERQTKRHSLKLIRQFEKKHDMELVRHLWTCEFPVRHHSQHFSGYKACGICIPCTKGIQSGFIDPSAL